MTLNSVVLPAPFGPISPMTELSSTSNVAPLTATTPPKRTCTSSTSSRANGCLQAAARTGGEELGLSGADGWFLRQRQAVVALPEQQPAALLEQQPDEPVGVADEQPDADEQHD